MLPFVIIGSIVLYIMMIWPLLMGDEDTVKLFYDGIITIWKY